MILLRLIRINFKLFLFVCLMVFNATFNNSSVISLRSVLLVEETGGYVENYRIEAYNLLLTNSCVARCGQHIDRSFHCQCNSACTRYNDCCHDYQSYCLGGLYFIVCTLYSDCCYDYQD